MGMKKRTYSGVKTLEISEREKKNRDLSRKAAAEGVVLLKNNGLLPLSLSARIAVFGNGIARIIKGGTGSGDVNERAVVSMVEGLSAAGYEIVNKAGAEKYAADHARSRNVWRDRVLEELEKLQGGSDMAFFDIIANTKGEDVEEIPIVEEELQNVDAVLYIISRVAGEGSDRHTTEGDYYLTSLEKEQLKEIAKYNQKIVVIVNTGAQIDITALQEEEAIKSIVYLSQPGMEAGYVIADIVSGKVNPSGKLTTTWSLKYEDFPNAATFSHMNGDTTNEKYEEGIYVGYRYFDSFGVKTLYPFGYGLSYTSFEMKPEQVEVSGNTVKVKVTVRNSGEQYAENKLFRCTPLVLKRQEQKN